MRKRKKKKTVELTNDDGKHSIGIGTKLLKRISRLTSFNTVLYSTRKKNTSNQSFYFFFIHFFFHFTCENSSTRFPRSKRSWCDLFYSRNGFFIYIYLGLGNYLSHRKRSNRTLRNRLNTWRKIKIINIYVLRIFKISLLKNHKFSRN